MASAWAPWTAAAPASSASSSAAARMVPWCGGVRHQDELGRNDGSFGKGLHEAQRRRGGSVHSGGGPVAGITAPLAAAGKPVGLPCSCIWCSIMSLCMHACVRCSNCNRANPSSLAAWRLPQLPGNDAPLQ